MTHAHLTRRAFLAGAIATPVLAACGGGGDDDAAPSEGSATTGGAPTTTATTAAPTTTTPPVVAPLTGMPFAGDPAFLARQALIVKIDNADNGSNTARPQAGFNQADIVIEELVEGGVTRLAAVFHSQDADPVGPIRSARITDLEYVSFFGHPLFAWSGGNAEVAGAIRNSPLLQDVGYDVLGGGSYFRAGDRRSPHNLMSSTPALYAAAGGGAAPTPVLTYADPAPLVAPNWRPAAAVDVAFSSAVAAAPSTFDFDPARGWARSQEGSPHVDAAGEQIVVQSVLVLDVEYSFRGGDSSGNAVPHGDLVGSGFGVALAGGMAADITWSRPDEASPITFALGDGSPLVLPPGKSWWSLPPAGSATVR